MIGFLRALLAPRRGRYARREESRCRNDLAAELLTVPEVAADLADAHRWVRQESGETAWVDLVAAYHSPFVAVRDDPDFDRHVREALWVARPEETP